MLKGTNYTTLRAAIPDVFDTIDDRHVSPQDIVEWSAKALGQIDAYEVYEPDVKILNVVDYQTQLPKCMLQINQILYKTDFTTGNNIAEDDYAKLMDAMKCCASEDDVTTNLKIKSFFSQEYIRNYWFPMRASTNDFMRSIICENSPNLITNCEAQFQILPNGKLITNIEKTTIIVSYLKAATDANGDYIIPNDDELIEALRLYCMMRIWERRYNRQEQGAEGRYKDYRQMWGLYKNMVRGKFKLPSSDEYQNILDYSVSLLPKRDRYYTYFGTLNSPDTKFF